MNKVQTLDRNGLSAEWLLNGNALDTSGNSLNGTTSSITYTNTDRGYQKQCAVGTAGRITGTGPSISGNWSISFWAYRTATSNDNGTVVEIGTVAGSGFGVIIWGAGGMGITNGALDWWVNNLHQAAADYTATNIVLPLNTWSHCVFTYNGTDVKSYQDNVLKSTIAFTTNPTASALHALFDRRGAAGNYYKGQLQGVRVYNREVKIQEVQTLYMEGMRKLTGTGLAPLSDGLVSYYDMNGDANDIIGGNNGTVTGASLTTDQFGTSNQAYSFVAASSQYINCGDVNLGTGAVTVSAWIYRTGAINDYTGIVSKGAGTGATNEVSLQFGGAGTSGVNKIAFEIHDSSSNNTFLQDTSTTINTNTWYHVVGVFSPSTFQKIYINGVEVATTGSTRANMRNGTQNLEIGRQYQTAGRYFEGKITGTMLFTRALSASEVLALYQLSSQRYLTPLLF